MIDLLNRLHDLREVMGLDAVSKLAPKSCRVLPSDALKLICIVPQAPGLAGTREPC